MKSSPEIFRLASGVWARHRPDCETDFVKSWVKNRPRLKLWMTKIYKVNFMIYSLWPERNNRAHKLIREVFTEAPATDAYGKEAFLQPHQLFRPSNYIHPFILTVFLWWRNWGLLVTKVNLLCHQESVNHTELCGYNRLESIITTSVLSIAHKPVITSHLEDCQLLQYDLLCDPVVFNDRHRLHHLPIICNIKEDFWPTCGNPAAKHTFSFQLWNQTLPQ